MTQLRDSQRRDFLATMLFAIDEGRELDEALEPFTQTRLREAGWMALFALGPLFFICFRGRWEGEVFGTRVRRVIRGMQAGKSVSQRISRRMRPWFRHHELKALKAAEAEGRLRETLEILLWKPNRESVLNVVLAYALVMLSVISGLGIFIIPKFQHIAREMGRVPPVFGITFQNLLTVSYSLFFLALTVELLRDHIFWRIPVIGRGWRSEHLAEFAYGVAASLNNGTDIAVAVEHAGQCCRKRSLRKQAARCAAEIAQGQQWFVALRQQLAFDSFSLWILSSASDREDPKAGFTAVAEWCENEARRTHLRYRRWSRRITHLVCAVGVLLCAMSILGTLAALVAGTY